MAPGGRFVANRVARVRSSFERQGMRSQRILLPDGLTTMHCWIPPASSNPPVLLIHGFGWNGMMTWESQVSALLAAEFAVYVPDLVFFGESFTKGSLRSEGFQAECLVAMLRELGVGVHVDVVATSYGGLVAMKLASVFPMLVRKVVIASSGVCMDAADGAALHKKLNVDDMRRFLLPTTAEGVKRAFKFLLSTPPRLPDSVYQELLEEMYQKNRDEKIELYNESSFATDEAHLQPTLTQEVLLVWGENDRLFDTDQGRKLKEHLGGSTQLVIIKNAGHTPESEAPRPFNNAVLAFLKNDSSHQSRL